MTLIVKVAILFIQHPHFYKDMVICVRWPGQCDQQWQCCITEHCHFTSDTVGCPETCQQHSWTQKSGQWKKMWKWK